jgi:deoxyxylulose-5-phosphate synthase
MGGVSIDQSTIGVLPKQLVSSLSGSTYKYESTGGKKSKKSTKKSRKSAKKSRKSSKKTAKKWFPMLGF